MGLSEWQQTPTTSGRKAESIPFIKSARDIDVKRNVESDLHDYEKLIEPN